jgi:hypothetical protein
VLPRYRHRANVLLLAIEAGLDYKIGIVGSNLLACD